MAGVSTSLAFSHFVSDVGLQRARPSNSLILAIADALVGTNPRPSLPFWGLFGRVLDLILSSLRQPTVLYSSVLVELDT